MENFVSNQVCGESFLGLTEDDLKQLIPLIGVRSRLRQLIRENQKVDFIGKLNECIYSTHFIA